MKRHKKFGPVWRHRAVRKFDLASLLTGPQEEKKKGAPHG